MAFQIKYIYDLVDRMSPDLKKIKNNLKRTEKGVRAFANKAVKSFQKVQKKLEKLKKVGKDLFVKLTVPILALGTASVVAFARMETGLVNINNLLSKEQLKVFSKDLKRLQEEGIKAGFTVRDVNQSLFDTISALGASERSFTAFTAAQKLAVGGNTDLSVAVDGITSLMSVYEDTNITATEAANAFFSAQVKGKTTVEQLANAVGQVAPIAKASGVGFKELLAAMAALTTGGLSTDEAATSLKGTFTALIKPTDEAKKVLKAMNVPFGAVNIKARGLSKTLLSLAKAQKKFGVDAIAKAIPNIRAFTAVTSLSETKLALLDLTVQKINDDLKSGDGLMRAFIEQQATLARKFAVARGQMTVAMQKFAIVFAPILVKIAEKVAILAEKFANLSPFSKKLIVSLLGILAVLAPLLIAFAVIAPVVSIIGGAIAALSVPVQALIGLILILIITFKTVWDWIKKISKALAGGFVKTLESIKGFFGGDSPELINQKDIVTNNIINSGKDIVTDNIINSSKATNQNQSPVEIGGRLDINFRGIPKGSSTGFTPIPGNQLPIGMNQVFEGG